MSSSGLRPPLHHLESVRGGEPHDSCFQHKVRVYELTVNSAFPPKSVPSQKRAQQPNVKSLSQHTSGCHRIHLLLVACGTCYRLDSRESNDAHPDSMCSHCPKRLYILSTPPQPDDFCTIATPCRACCCGLYTNTLQPALRMGIIA